VGTLFFNKRASDISNSTLPLAKSIHFKAIRIFTENCDKGTKAVAYLWACDRVHAYHGTFSFHAACSWGARLDAD